MTHKVLISAPYLLNDIKKFEAELVERQIDFDVYPVEERLEEADLLPIIGQYHGIICGDDRLTPKVIDAADNLKVIVKWGTGIDSIDKPYAESKGILVCNTLNAFTQPVSDSILAYVLAFARRIMVSDNIMKNGGWEKAFGVCLEEITVGIIGVGNIGKATARKLKPFGSRVLATDIKKDTDDITLSQDLKHVELTSLDKLLSESDYVCICCDLNDTSRHLMQKKQFGLMKKSAFFINVARGPIVKEDDLVAALQNEQIAGAALDVFEEEPLAKESPLRQMDNCFLSSHNVNASPLYWNKIHRNSLNMLYKGLGL